MEKTREKTLFFQLVNVFLSVLDHESRREAAFVFRQLLFFFYVNSVLIRCFPAEKYNWLEALHLGA